MESRNKRSFGTKGEEIAVKYLKSKGYSIIKRNFRVGRLGEVDIIATAEGCICFIEVKTRSSLAFGTPAEAVVRSKQHNITKIASVYLSQNNSFDKNIRFDVIEILLDKNCIDKPNLSINHIINAF